MATKGSLTQAIQGADKLFPGSKSASPIMKFIASAESNYGNYNPETALSYGPFQIDPIRYYDIAQNPDRVNQSRVGKANEYLRQKLNNPDFDISKLGAYNPETKGYDDVNLEMMRNPDVGAVLTRMALMQDAGDLPDEEGLGSYYESFWGPKWSQSPDENIKAKKRQEAIEKYREHNMPSSTMEQAKLTNSAFTQ